MGTPEGMKDLVDEIDAKVGLDQLKLLHVNDSRDARGSNRDRHAPIGKGEIGRRGMRAFLGEPRLQGLPAVLEGPGVDGKARCSQRHPDHPPPAPRGGPEPQLMLFNRRALDGIAAGEIDLAFRRWKRPTVRTGGTLHTSAGLLGIDAVEPTPSGRSTGSRPAAPGSPARGSCIESLRPEGRLFRIRFHRIGDDPRVELRARAPITKSRSAPSWKPGSDAWIAPEANRGRARVLELIRDRPETLAADLAASIGMEKAPFKRDVRRLKELGPDREPPGRIPALAAGPRLCRLGPR